MSSAMLGVVEVTAMTCDLPFWKGLPRWLRQGSREAHCEAESATVPWGHVGLGMAGREEVLLSRLHTIVAASPASGIFKFSDQV